MLVALVVAAAAAYAAWAITPRALRRSLANRALEWSQGSARCPQWLRTRLASAAATASAAAC